MPRDCALRSGNRTTANFMLNEPPDKHPCVAFLPGTPFRAETAAKSLSQSFENVGRSDPKEAAGFGAAAKGGGRSTGSRCCLDHELGKQRNSADGTLPSLGTIPYPK